MQNTKRLWYLYGILPGVASRCEWRGTNTFYLGIITNDNTAIPLVIPIIITYRNCTL